MRVDFGGISIRKIVRLGALRDARLERALHRVTSEIISARPALLLKQDLRIRKMLLTELLKQLPVEPDHETSVY